MVRNKLPIVDAQEYQSSVKGHVTVSSGDLDLEGAYVSWHTQPDTASECVRPPTADHQFVLYCSDEERGEYRYNDRQWQNYVKRRNEWFIAPAFENQIVWRWRGAQPSGLVCRFHLSPGLIEQAASLQHDCAIYSVRIPGQREHRFWGKMNTDSDRR